MNAACRVCVTLAVLLATSCGRRGPTATGPREETFLTVDAPKEVSSLVSPGLVRTSERRLVMTLFIHSRFPTAVESRDAIAVFESTDDGATWTRISTIPSFVTYGVWGYDLAIDGSDSLYLTWVAAVYDAETRVPFKAVMFARSQDGGRSWTEPVQVNDSRVGQRHEVGLAVHGSNVYVAWLEPTQEEVMTPTKTTIRHVYLASSSDGGATWSASRCIEVDLDRKLSSSGRPSLCVDADGTVYCAYFSSRQYEKAVGGYWLAKSQDGGKTFSTALQDVGPLGDICLDEADGTLYLAAVYIRGIRSLARQSPKTSQEIRLYTSTDGGEEWTEPVLIDDDEGHERKTSLQLVSVGVDRLVACWDDGRGGVYVAASTDGGENWGKNVKVAGPSPVGATPLGLAVDASSGAFYLVGSKTVKGAGDETYLIKGVVHP